MGFYDAIRVGASGAADSGYTIDRSLRFNKSEYHYLTRTPSSTGNQKVWTFSAWIKRTNLVNNNHYIYSAHSGSDYFSLYFQNDNLYSYYSPGNNYGVISDREFRDVGAWFHLVHQVDAANTTQRVWINGEELSLNSGRNPGNSNYPMNESGVAMVVGTASWWLDNNASDMYLAEVHYSDGNKYTPSDFVETDADTGQLIPKEVAITYGTNGFYLNFSDNSGTTATTLGKDSSGNGNNFTPTNLATNDAVKDSPTNNFCTFNPLSNYDGLTLAEGNLKATSTSGWKQTRGIIGVSSGKWYFEVRCNSIDVTESWIAGIHEVFGRDTDNYYWYNPSYTATGFGYAYGVQDNNQKRGNTASMDGSFSSDVTAGKVVGIRMNLDDNEILISVDGVDKGKMYDIQSGITYAPAVNIYGSSSATLNCGQDSTFHGQESSGGNTDSGGIGDFAYAVPSGYKALCSANLPDPTILLPNNHFNTLLYTGNGAASGHQITGLNFQPDWVWIKNRGETYDHMLFDALRGVGKYLESNDTTAEATGTHLESFDSDGFTVGQGNLSNRTNANNKSYVGWSWNAGDTDGKTYTVKVVSDSGNKYRFDDFGTSAVTLDLAEGGTYIFDGSDSSMASHPIKLSETSNGTHGGGSSYNTGVTYLLDGASVTESAYVSGYASATTRQLKIVVAASAPTLYYYCHYHSGMGGAINTNSTLGSSNFDGSIQTTVKANQSAGFSIVLYEGQGSSDITLGHGLNAVPNVVLVKERTGTRAWIMYHSTLGANKYLQLATTQVALTNNDLFGNTTPTSSVFTVSDAGTSDSGDDYVAYCFSSVVGYSKFGSYTGNNANDGTFVFTGFSVAFLLVKRTDSTRDWLIYDNKRSTFNVIDDFLEPNNITAEQSASANSVDFVSNGFKFRNNSGDMNGAGTYIYFAFAEAPFKNARAR